MDGLSGTIDGVSHCKLYPFRPEKSALECASEFHSLCPAGTSAGETQDLFDGSDLDAVLVSS